MPKEIKLEDIVLDYEEHRGVADAVEHFYIGLYDLKEESQINRYLFKTFENIGFDLIILKILDPEDKTLKIEGKKEPEDKKKYIETPEDEITYVTAKNCMIEVRTKGENHHYSINLVHPELSLLGKIILGKAGGKEKILNFLGKITYHIIKHIGDIRISKQKDAYIRSDSMTSLFNQPYIDEEIEKKIEYCKRNRKKMSLVMLDIDEFKEINDTYGHLAGNEVIKDLAKILKENVRTTDVVARYGGDEFSILLPDTNIDEAYKIMERIREQIENKPAIYDNKAIGYTISAGIAEFDGTKDSTKEDIIEKADKALYFGKNKGRNMVTKYDQSTPDIEEFRKTY